MNREIGRETGEFQQTSEQSSILRVAVITSFITTFMGSALNLSIPQMEEQFGVSAAMIGWVVTAFTLSVAALSVPFGKLADATGRRRVFLLGIILFVVFSVMCAFSPNIWMLLLCRVLQGVASSMIFATNNAILISVFPPEQRGRVLGTSVAGTYIGLSAGPVIGGILNHYINWQSIFIMSAVIAAISLVIAIKGIPKKPMKDTSSGGIDIAGNILYIACIVVTLYGLTNLSVMKYAWIILIAGIVLGAVFVITEKKAKDPVIRISMFTQDAAFTLSNLAALLNYGATFAISYLMSIYLQIIMGYSSQTAGLIIIAMPLMQAIFSPTMGRLSDRIAPYKLATAGMAICAAGLICFSLVGLDTPLFLIILILIMEGFGFSVFSSPNSNAIMSCVEKKDYSIAQSIQATMRTVGHTSSMAIVTIVIGMQLGNTTLAEAEPAQLVHTMHTCFAVFIVLCIAGTFMSMKRRKTDVN